MEGEPMMKVHEDSGRLFKRFPHCPKSVPMSLLNEEWARRNHGQSLARLNERGGLYPCELLANIEKRLWKDIPTGIAIDQLIQFLEKMNTNQKNPYELGDKVRMKGKGVNHILFIVVGTLDSTVKLCGQLDSGKHATLNDWIPVEEVTPFLTAKETATEYTLSHYAKVLSESMAKELVPLIRQIVAEETKQDHPGE